MISLMNRLADAHFRKGAERTAGLYSVYPEGEVLLRRFES
jgi:hypothetical protein